MMRARRAMTVILGGGAVALALACGGKSTQDTAILPAVQSAAPVVSSPRPAPAPKPVPVAQPAAATGEIEVVTAAAVQVSIDGSPVLFDPIRGSFRKRKLSAGNHTVEVFNAIGKNVASETVDVKPGERAKYRYKMGGRFEGFGSFPIDD